jgi:hypothetical protein
MVLATFAFAACSSSGNQVIVNQGLATSIRKSKR